MKMLNIRRMGLAVALGIAALAAANAADDPVSFVDPFVGTAGTGHTTPAACVPFGLVQAGPDTGADSWDYCSGYRYDDKAVWGFSQTHLNGTGGSDLGDVLIQPFAAKDLASVVKTSKKGRLIIPSVHEKATEVAEPGYYATTLTDSGVRVEATATARVAFYRFTYNGEAPARLLVDLQYGIGGNAATQILESDVRLTGKTGLCGTNRRRAWVDRRYSFAVAFNRPCTAVEELPKRPGEKAPRYVFDFGLKRGEPLLVKVALSAEGGIEGAQKNLAAELSGWNFNAVRMAARAAWNRELGAAVAEGTVEQKKNWYTSLYHLFVQPNDIADASETPFYSTFSCWDTFRAAGPLYTILCPDRATAFVDSMLEQGRRTGYLPIWTLWGKENQCMIGKHSVPMIVDAYLKGVWRGDAEAAFAQIKDTLTRRHEGSWKEDWDLYDRHGYYPFDKIKGESVSRTLEIAYDDWCAAQMAKVLGKEADAAFFAKRAGNWRNIYDASTGFVRGKDSNGNWREPFDPYAFGHSAELANDFTEGNAFQYSWHVMQDAPGLVAAMGGRDSFVKKLDALFAAPDKVGKEGCVLDITGLIGQYVHGNEPSHHVIYFYPQIGQPEKAAARIREVFDRFYLPKPDGLCGNDDCGQMSAWYLFSAMGFYPFNPCGGEYIIGAPQLPRMTLRLADGKTFTVVAKNLSKENKFVKSVTLNGKPVTDWRIRHADIVKGGELVFEMAAK